MPLARTGGLQRRTPLQPTAWPRTGTGTGLARSTGLQPTPWKRGKGVPQRLPETPTRRRPHPAGPDALTVQLVLVRDEGRCFVCAGWLTGERGWDWSIHHRRGRDGKPDSHSLQNLILVCGSDNQSGCHGRIHQRRSWAHPNGFWLSRAAGEDPLLVPIRRHGLPELVWLTADGISDLPPTQAGGA